MTARSWLATVSAALALGGVGCGGDDREDVPRPPGDAAPVLGKGLPAAIDHPVTAAIERLQRAFVANDYEGVCTGITRAAARQAGEAGHGDPTTCERDLRRLFEMIRDGGGMRHAGKPRVIDVEVDGGEAVATVALDRRWQARVPLTREAGRWRLSGMFGTPSGRGDELAESIVDASFPPAGRRAIEAEDDAGNPCPELSHASYPQIAGGCVLELAGRTAPLRMLTAFGDFEFDECRIEYSVRVDASGRTWIEALDVAGDEKSVGCGDVRACYDYSAEAPVPWRGRIYPDGDGAFLHRTDMCLATCVGYFVGDLTVRLVRDGERWRADPVDGGGDSGFRFESSLRAKGDLGIEVADAGAGS